MFQDLGRVFLRARGNNDGSLGFAHPGSFRAVVAAALSQYSNCIKTVSGLNSSYRKRLVACRTKAVLAFVAYHDCAVRAAAAAMPAGTPAEQPADANGPLASSRGSKRTIYAAPRQHAPRRVEVSRLDEAAYQVRRRHSLEARQRRCLPRHYPPSRPVERPRQRGHIACAGGAAPLVSTARALSNRGRLRTAHYEISRISVLSPTTPEVSLELPGQTCLH